MMKPKTYNLLERCIEDGVQMGWNRAHKHTETPDPIWLREQIYQAIMFEIHEWFDIQGENIHE